ncbi:hypothetical protein BOTBODRAFT_187949 [Botryobasidium botryosum FD-172 SS1]|uniref:C2H2-type domain-containing protein n=1 Tax=Botryobasidium botryosum (strain FD-172 SS1) TaxID=930990 RepID=A0A067MI10_BOTB1|nr:hypothetical protein BOTBODRAFT_187949 [Botryobasidium botryosum FD-172 SS1]
MAPLRPQRRGNVCAFCGKRLVHLKRHVNDVHTQDTKYRCNFEGCTFEATQKANLSKHRKIHDLEETGGTAFAVSSVDTDASLGSHSISAAQAIPGVLVENSDLPGPSQGIFMGEGFSPPPRPLHPLRFILNERE